MGVLFAVISVQVLAISHAHSGVPVVIWGNSGAQLPNPRAAQATSNKDFLSKYLEPLVSQNGHNLVTFIQDKLSLDDITQNGDVYNSNSQGGTFHNLKGLVESHSSLSLPSVDSPVDSIKKISSKKRVKTHELRSPYDVHSLKLNPEGGNLIKVHLPASDSPVGMRDIDNVLGSVSSALKKLGPSFTAVYTGLRNSLIPAQPAYAGRHLLQAEMETGGNYTFFNLTANGTSCVLLYTTGVQFSLRPNLTALPGAADTLTTWSLPNKIGDYDDTSVCNETHATLAWSYTKNLPDGMTKFEAKTSFVLLITGYWRMSNLIVSYATTNSSGDDVPMNIKEVWAPRYYSYHCSAFQCKLSATSTGNNYTTQMEFSELQVQYQIKKDQFGQANDCVGFFTIPIWMGLVTALVLITILSFGVMMLASINTQDRFDDPKGKTISVPVGE